MRRVPVLFVIGVVGVVWLGGCARRPVKPSEAVKPVGPVKLTEADAGRTVELHVGEKLEVVLAGNPTTGYDWEVAALNANVLRPVGEHKYTRESERIGSGGKMSFGFEAMAAGQTKLELIYHRPWEKDVKLAKTFEVSVVVK